MQGASDRSRSNVSGSNPAQSRVEDQPRPALGLRPWFALLRRARNLRRFALAIRPKRITALRSNVPIHLIAEVPGVFLIPVVVPITLWSRFRGIKGVPPGHGVLLATSAVHSFGLEEPLTVLAVNEKGRVLTTRDLPPSAMWRHSAARWLLELPTTTITRSEGVVVRLFHGIGGWPRGDAPHPVASRANRDLLETRIIP